MTPTRYLYSGFEEYLNHPPRKLGWIPFYKIISKPFLDYVRHWDQVAAQRPDEYIAISSAVKDRIKKFYGRESVIVYPPVDIDKFKTRNSKFATPNLKKNDYYLIAGRLVPYKKVDLAIEAFIKLKKKLVVVGTGSEENKYKMKYKSEHIEFKGFVSDNELVSLYQNAKAFINPQDEDFGITAVEAQAAGCPVIAYKSGGALDTVRDGETGVFFNTQTVDNLGYTVRIFENMKFVEQKLITNANNFSKTKFQNKFLEITNY
jgi:glycosyltransferase involved in cell wall biosynthesis